MRSGTEKIAPKDDIALIAPLRALPKDSAPQGSAKVASLAVVPSPAPRVASVDALRGLSMLVVLGADILAKGLDDMLSHGGAALAAVGHAIKTQFTHADWNGAHFYDLVFPLFIFVTGVSIVFSLPKLVEKEGKWTVYKRILRRSVLLFALGIICYGGVAGGFDQVRIGGVLQRIALCYLIASLIFVNTGVRGMAGACAGLLVGYWALMSFVPVPGMNTASLEPDVNLANWIDANYLPGRKWNGSWDPEGILTTLPAIATCLLGVFAGLLLKNPKLDGRRKTLWLLDAGVLLIAAGLLWGLQFPINKYLWTSSFVLFAGGVAALMLGVFHEIMDVRGYKAWAAPFIWVGASAIVLYVSNFLLGFYPLAERIIGGDVARLANAYIAEGFGKFSTALLGMLLAVAAARFLYQRRIFLRV